MAAWCFVCDVEVLGGVCAGCGREPTMIEEPAMVRRPLRVRFGEAFMRIPRLGRILMAVALVVALFTVVGSKLHLG